MKPEDITFHPGGHAFKRDIKIEALFLRNLIEMAEHYAIASVVTFDCGISPKLGKKMETVLGQSAKREVFLFDLEIRAHRRFANEHLGCNLPDLPPPNAGLMARGRIARHTKPRPKRNSR